ncbi:MAG: TIGR03862 family flavoprotein [Methylovulum miyakonense]|uniref:TIGR03862 family flavoprotein n=1 Tax=Methylovulum miyakonense TaxID=645578 RepID=UPI003BB79390
MNNFTGLAESPLKKQVAIIGGGPAGLMAAEVLCQANIQVDVYDAMPSVGRKFLMAGKGGMNITHSEPFPQFLSRYGGHASDLEAMLGAFSPAALRQWLQTLGIDTFVGSSGRVFPTDMKAAPLLRAWLRRLREAGAVFHTRHCWTGWAGDNTDGLVFQSPQGEQKISADAVVFALGGASWPQLGSTGRWVPIFQGRKIPVRALLPSNCGFETAWTNYFKNRYAGQPVKTVAISFTDAQGQAFGHKGEFVITETGVEGGLVYSLSSHLRTSIASTGKALVFLDLLPDKGLAWLSQRLSRGRGKESMSNYLRKNVGIDGVKAGLLRELLPAADFDNPEKLALAIKSLPITLLAARPIEEAISSAGGVPFSALDEGLMLRSAPGLFCAGEMLDWEAPTGGYLLTACFASGRRAGEGVIDWFESQTQGHIRSVKDSI